MWWTLSQLWIDWIVIAMALKQQSGGYIGGRG
jgi:hypothetical protein